MAVVAANSLGACASGRSHGSEEKQQIIVHLTNDLAPPSDVTVYAVSEGTRRLLGDVPPNKDRALTVPTDIFSGTSFRIVAERTGGRTIVSQPITASSGSSIVDWDLQTNSIWFPETGR